MGYPTHITDHVDRGFSRLLAQSKPVKGFGRFLRVFTEQDQAVEDALWDELTKKYLDGEGAQLDLLGKLLKEPRDGWDDAQYLTRLRARILVLRSSGTGPDIIKIFNTLLPGNIIYFSAMGGASFVLQIGEINVDFADIYARYIYESKTSGVGGQGVYTTDLDHTFTFAPDTSILMDSDKGFGDEANPLTGGIFSGVL